MRKPIKPREPVRPASGKNSKIIGCLGVWNLGNCKISDLPKKILESLSSRQHDVINNQQDVYLADFDFDDQSFQIKIDLEDENKYKYNMLNYEKEMQTHKLKMVKYDEDLKKYEQWQSEKDEREFERLRKKLGK